MSDASPQAMASERAGESARRYGRKASLRVPARTDAGPRIDHVAACTLGVVVQLVRIPACHAGGRGFESRPLRQFPESSRLSQSRRRSLGKT